MARVDWKDIEQNQSMDNAAMDQARGGRFSYANTPTLPSHPGRNAQSGWITRSQPFGAQHSSFVSFLRN